MGRPNGVLAGMLRVFHVHHYILLWGLSCFPVVAWSSEAALRAAFVFNFIKFIDWPASNPGNVLHFCVVNASGETREALQHIDGKSVKDHAVSMVYLHHTSLNIQQFQRCQILYLPFEHSVELPPSLPAGVVLVVDEPTTNKANVSISIWKQKDSRIAFSINEKAVNQAGVSISSQLLKLALVSGKEGE